MSPSSAPTESVVRIFLSYSSDDEPLARELQSTIGESHIRCFLAVKDIQRQQFWQPELEAELRAAHLLLLLYTKSARESKWVEWEVTEAAKLALNIWAVMDENVKPTPFLDDQPFMKRHQYALRRGRQSDCFEDIRKDLNDLYPRPLRSYRGRITADNCPYPGMSAYDEREPKYPYFPPRIAVNQILRALGGPRPAPVLLVSGPSGAGKSSLLRAGLRKHIPDWYLQKPIDANKASEPHQLLAGALDQLRSAQPELRDLRLTGSVAEDLASAIERAYHTHFLFPFDQMENFFAGHRTRDEIKLLLKLLKDVDQMTRFKNVVFIVSFRKEYLMEVERYVEEHFRDNFAKVFIFKMSCDDARTSIIGACEDRDVYFDREFADELVRGLEQGGSDAEPVVNPMDIQKVLKELWLGIAALDPVEYRIDANSLSHLIGHNEAYRGRLAAGDPADLPRKFIELVLADFLRKTIDEIALNMRKDPGYVWANLSNVFVGGSGERLRRRVDTKNGKAFVGRLEMEHINVLVDKGLVQNCGNDEFELVHDSLAEQIAREGASREEVVGIKVLAEVLEKDAGSLALNQHTELLEKMERLRTKGYVFEADEAAVVFGCALGDKRQSIAKTPIRLEQWAGLLAEKSPKDLLRVLANGLGGEESVQLDVLDIAQGELLGRADVRAECEEFTDLIRHIRELSLIASGEVQARACCALVALDDSEGIQSVFGAHAAGELHAARAIAMIRHGIDTLSDENCQAWRAHWKSLSRLQQCGILARLCFWRLRNAYSWIGLIIASTAPFTAIGAILPFIPAGATGASLTLEDTNFGAFAGIFHGATGGLVWGVGVTIGLLVYSIIWRGGRLRRRFRETLGLSIFAMLGAATGGLLNAFVIVYAFSPEGLFRGGWLDPELEKVKGISQLVLNHGRTYQAFVDTRHGWIMPIFGAALGMGIGWALMTILSDPTESWIARNEKGRVRLASGDFAGALTRIGALVMRNSWRNIVWLAIGSLLTLSILRPGKGVCDTPSYRPDLNAQIYSLEQCEEQYLMPSIAARTAGLAIIILGGSVFQETGFLFTLLWLQFGADLRRRVKENDTFLRSSGAVLAA